MTAPILVLVDTPIFGVHVLPGHPSDSFFGQLYSREVSGSIFNVGHRDECPENSGVHRKDAFDLACNLHTEWYCPAESTQRCIRGSSLDRACFILA